MSIFDPINRTFGGFNQKVSGLGLPGGLGLLQAGTDILGGQPIGQAVRGGLQTFQSVSQLDEERKRKELVKKLVSDGGFTPQEQQFLAALPSDQVASAALKIRSDKQAAANKLANKVTMDTLSAEDVSALGLPEGTIVQRNNQTQALNILREPKTPKETTTETRTRLADEYKLSGDARTRYILTGSIENNKETAAEQRTALADIYQLNGEERKSYILTGKLPTPPNDKDRFQEKGAYKVGDQIIASVTFDKTTGQLFYKQPTADGEVRVDIDVTQATPLTDSYFSLGIPNTSQFMKLKEKVRDDSVSLKRYTSYLKNIENAGVGLERLGDDLTAYFKTLFSTNADRMKLSEEELALRVARGELQGLIGRSRIETVGGGVMTEQDALRIIQNLGGDVSLLQNPEVVRQQISRLFEDKYSSYESNIRDYNTAVDQRYGALDYEKITPIEVDTSLLSADVVKNLGLSTSIDGIPTNELTANQIKTMKKDDLLNLDIDQLTPEAVQALIERLQ